MTRPATFLHALANLLSTSTLYGPGHPAHRKALAEAWGTLEGLLEQDSQARFNFLEDEVVYGLEPLRDLKGWPWSRRFAAAGIQRLEIEQGVTEEELAGFVARLMDRLELGAEHRAAPAPHHPHIRYGAVGLRVGDRRRRRVDDRLQDPPLELMEESEAVAWINESAGQGKVPAAEAAAVVRGLSVAMHDMRQLVAPLLEIKSTDQYTTAHCINVSILSMSLAEYLKFTDAEVRSVGEAALLHDVGKTRIPLDLLNKPGALTEEERRAIEAHPVEGAKLLLAGEERLSLAATVAYEHHMHYLKDGGYPRRHYKRKPHRFSRVVQVCDVYDALRTRRPFRGPLSGEAALLFLEERAGSEFDPELVRAFTEMMRQWEPPTVAADGEEEQEDMIGAGELSRLPSRPFDADLESPLDT